MEDYEFINEQNKKLQEQDKKVFKARLRHERIKTIIYITLLIILLVGLIIIVRNDYKSSMKKCLKNHSEKYCLMELK